MSKINRKKRARKIELKHRKRARVKALLKKLALDKSAAGKKQLILKIRKMNRNIELPKAEIFQEPSKS